MSISRWMTGSTIRGIDPYSRTRLDSEKNGLWKCAITWMHLNIIILSKRSQTKRIHTVRFNLYKILENSDSSIGKESR